MNWLQTLDFEILEGIQNMLKCGMLDAIMTVISKLGGGIIWGVFGVLFLFFRKRRWDGIAILGALAVAAFLTELVIKPIFLRERPFMLNPEHTLIVLPPFGTSFPSGHTTTSFATAVQFFRINKLCGAAACGFALLVAFSRLYLYVHFPSDVLAGCVLGILIGWGCAKLMKLMQKKFSKNKTA